MSILVKGMKMPRCCSECRFFVDAWCYAMDANDWRNAYNKPPDGEKLQSCPLNEIPPHGRLIDADELKAAMYMDNYKGFATRHDADVCFNYVNNAPTIIEAEE